MCSGATNLTCCSLLYYLDIFLNIYYLDIIKLYKKCFYYNGTLLNLTSMLSTFK
jgi:hypothetical protein